MVVVKDARAVATMTLDARATLAVVTAAIPARTVTYAGMAVAVATAE